MLRNEASIRELFYQPYTTDRSFVPQDDSRLGYTRDRYGVYKGKIKLITF
jgi:hypothetical protein